MTNLTKRLTFCGAQVGLCLLAATPAPAATAWTSGGQRAGLAAKGGGETIGFSCAGTPAGRMRLVLSGFDAKLLQTDLDYTVVVTVDGTAYRQSLRAVAGAPGRRDLSMTGPSGELQPLVEALAAGAKAEIASPAGREPLSLKGSGKALKALRAACS